MQLDDIRFLFGFDRWATEKVLAAAEIAHVVNHGTRRTPATPRGDLDMVDYIDTVGGGGDVT